jgi:CHASE2 domain-containing sensor protein
MPAARPRRIAPGPDFPTAVARAQRVDVREILLLGVPAAIAIALVLSVIFFWLSHPSEPIPEFIKTTLTAIIGYYFGSARRR